MTEKPPTPTPKTILITGGTSGLGAATAIALARLLPPGSRIYLAGRNATAAASLITSTSPEKPPTTQLIFLPLDLTSLPSIRSAALHLLALEPYLDVLLANAGIAAVAPGAPTPAGHEAHLGTNHVGHALLIRLLLPLLQAAPDGGRVVSVTSFAFRFARWGVPLTAAAGGGGGGGWLVDWMMVWRWLRYAESKLANVVYARELARRWPGVVSVSVCPGFVETEMVRGMRLCDRVGTRVMGWLEGGMVSAEVGARNQVWAAMVDRGELTSGGVYEPVGKEMEDLGAAAVDEELGERLWEWTEGEIKEWL
ncbi:oxidoreductase [Podospora conica]|nr:oxidoreductase [Schizothecium conicum]